MDSPSGAEFEKFVGSVVPLEDVRSHDADPGFDDLMGRIADRGSARALPSSALGGGLMLLAGLLAILFPGGESIRTSHFWRVAGSLGAQLASVGDGVALPLTVVGLLLLAAGLLLFYRRETASNATVWFTQAGVAGLGFVAILWAALGALWLVNFVVLLFLIGLYALGAIVFIGFVLGLLWALTP